jgi:hypothetical protein
MSSTNDTDTDELLGALFDEIVLPLSERLRSEGVQVFPEVPDVQWLSYYVRRKQVANMPADFYEGSCVDADDFALRMQTQWLFLGRPELAAEVARFAQVAALLRAQQGAGSLACTASAEVSPYVYVMF